MLIPLLFKAIDLTLGGVQLGITVYKKVRGLLTGDQSRPQPLPEKDVEWQRAQERAATTRKPPPPSPR